MSITNTSKKPALDWLFGGNPGAIVAQEVTGQREFVASTQLPTDMRGNARTVLEEAGVVFGDISSDDPLFCDATLPEGWRKEATEHHMWSKLIDQDGNERASIFYKAAFYDRSAFLSVTEP